MPGNLGKSCASKFLCVTTPAKWRGDVEIFNEAVCLLSERIGTHLKTHKADNVFARPGQPEEMLASQRCLSNCGNPTDYCILRCRLRIEFVVVVISKLFDDGDISKCNGSYLDCHKNLQDEQSGCQNYVCCKRDT